MGPYTRLGGSRGGACCWWTWSRIFWIAFASVIAAMTRNRRRTWDTAQYRFEDPLESLCPGKWREGAVGFSIGIYSECPFRIIEGCVVTTHQERGCSLGTLCRHHARCLGMSAIASQSGPFSRIYPSPRMSLPANRGPNNTVYPLQTRLGDSALCHYEENT